MPRAICIRKTKRYNPGDIVEIPRDDHPFIINGDFEMIKEKIIEDVVIHKPKPPYRRRRR